MALKFLKNFFEIKSREYPSELILIHLTNDKHKNLINDLNENQIYVETCPLFVNSCFGLISESGYVLKSELIALKNNKENISRIKLWAIAKRKAKKFSKMWYEFYKKA